MMITIPMCPFPTCAVKSATVTGGYFNETHGLRACAVSVYASIPISHSQMLNSIYVLHNF